MNTRQIVPDRTAIITLLGLAAALAYKSMPIALVSCGGFIFIAVLKLILNNMKKDC